ncbi:conserved oligomeric Golgi complex subunit 2 [Nilaparvata lugens]|uniref:conserved oligomeric Golgi complex subunit 2 n=1 Tax=Nilaparvata lugens TaxID=108931 RepID=UPI00193CACE8|nr:conserved oligomeric Golgi complex subunit 2 [Nilaparvata lugens]
MSTFPVPKCPSELCFSSNDFTRESFSVDHFLQEHRNKANLERMRDDLGVYLKVLRSAMIDLINKDYTDFVNLSTNLTGLDKAIDNIQTPLGQLKDELTQVQLNVNEAMAEVTSLLEKRRKIEEQKCVLASAIKVNSWLRKLTQLLIAADSCFAVLQRAVADYSQIKFHIVRCQKLLTPSDKLKCDQLGQKLTNMIDQRFISCLIDQQYHNLPTLLGMYLTLGRISDAEQLYRRDVVAPAMAKLINEEALAGQPRGLQGLYHSIISFVEEDMRPLLALTTASSNRSSPPIKGFQFIVKSCWPEVEERLEMNLTSIFAPGNPELFFQRYTESLKFLSKLEECCSNPETVHLLKNHASYSSFMHRWNLPVYFQIRFQEIAGKLEYVIDENESDLRKPKNKDSCFQLTVTETAWECLQQCWAEKVFIPQLAHRFWKLSLQVLARYYVWSGHFINKKLPNPSDEDIDNLVRLYADLETLCRKLPEFLSTVNSLFSNHFTLSNKMKENLKSSVDECSTQLSAQLTSAGDRVTQQLSCACAHGLRQVSEVPRLFRRTNRQAPSQPLPYVAQVLAPAARFHRAHSGSLRQPQLGLWLRAVVNDLTKQYYSCVCSVLTSVQKTEESLRRLKKIRERSSSGTAAAADDRNAGRDDHKIRMQLHLDVNSFCQQVESLDIKRHEIDQLQSLLNLVQTVQAKPTTDVK